MFKKKGLYTGPRVWIPYNHDGPDGKLLKGGWHYSVRQTRRWGEIPDQPLHLNDSATSEADWFYEYAQKGHESWVQKHGTGNIVVLQALNGDHPPEAQSDHPAHAEYKKSLGDES